MPVIVPLISDWNFTSSSTDPVSGTAAKLDVSVLDQIVHEQVCPPPPPLPTVTVTPKAGVSRFPLSSTARLRRVTVPAVVTVHANVQLVVPEARRQVVPPSVEMSTPVSS